METILWAVDLMLVAAFGFWALRQDQSEDAGGRPGANRLGERADERSGERAAKDGNGARREDRNA